MNLRSVKSYMNKINDRNSYKNFGYLVDGKYYFTNSFSVICVNEWNTCFGLIENDDMNKRLKNFVDDFNTYVFYKEVDIKNIKNTKDIKPKDDTIDIDSDYSIGMSELKKVINCIGGKRVFVMKSDNIMKYVIKIENNKNEFGYLLPCRKY